MIARFLALTVCLLTIFGAGALPAEKSEVVLKIEGLASSEHSSVKDILTKRVEFLLGRNVSVEISGDEVTISFEDSADPKATAEALSKRGAVSIMQVPLKYTVVPDREGGYGFMRGRLSSKESGATLTYTDMVPVDKQRVVSESKTLFTEGDLLRQALVNRTPPSVTDDPDKWWEVGLELNPQATREFAELTEKGLGQTILVLLDGELVYAGRIVTPVGGGRVILGFGKSAEQAKALAAVVRSGPLPAKPKLVASRLGAPKEPPPVAAAPYFEAQSHFYREYSWSKKGELLFRLIPQPGWSKADVPSAFPPTKIASFSFDDLSEKVILADGFANASPIGSADGGLVAYASYRSDTNGDKKLDERDNFEIATVRADGSSPELVVPSTKRARTFLLSPEGKLLAYTSTAKGTDRGSVTIVALDSKKETSVSSEKDDDWLLGFAPDSGGFLIASFRSAAAKEGGGSKPRAYEVFFVKADGSRIKLAGAETPTEFISFTPDGAAVLAFVGPQGADGSAGASALVRLSVDGKPKKELLAAARHPEVLAFSDDLSKAACLLDSEGGNGSRELCVADLQDGTEKRLGTAEATDFAGAAFSADGLKLAVCAALDTNGDGKADAADNHQIAVYHTVTGTKTIAADSSTYNRPAVFADGGQSVVFRRIKEDTDGDGLITPRDEGALIRVELKDSEETVLARELDDPSLFAVSPAGSRLIVSVRQPDTDDIRFRVINLGGTVLKVLEGPGF
jgi:Tol biopolymer transport system component